MFGYPYGSSWKTVLCGDERACRGVEWSEAHLGFLSPVSRETWAADLGLVLSRANWKMNSRARRLNILPSPCSDPSLSSFLSVAMARDAKEPADERRKRARQAAPDLASSATARVTRGMARRMAAAKLQHAGEEAVDGSASAAVDGPSELRRAGVAKVRNYSFLFLLAFVSFAFMPSFMASPTTNKWTWPRI